MKYLDGTYRQILQTMNDGVVAVSGQGEIALFNQAAADILGLAPEDVVGKPLAEVFLAGGDENDEFAQAVLNAVYQKGGTLRVSAPYRSPQGKMLHLEIAASYLEEGGVVVVFKDVTAYRRLYEQEKELTANLSEAYRALEDRNQSLEGGIRRIRLSRRLGAVLLLLVLGAAAVFHFGGESDLDALDSAGPGSGGKGAPSAMAVEAVERPLTREISLTGHFAPLNIVNIVSPFTGRIAKKHVEFGQEVEKGAPLLELETSEMMVKLREAEAEFIKAQQEYARVREWEESDEVRSAHRDFVRAKMALDSSRTKLESSRDLLERGIIPQDEYDALREQHDNRELDFTSAREKLEATREKGSEENQRIAEMALANARFKFQDVKDKLDRAVLVSPVDGLVIRSTAVEKGREQALEVGATFNEGDIFLAIGNMEGFTVTAQADEVDMVKLEVGQPVRIMSDALPDMELSGRVQSISSQATKQTGRNEIATFDVTVRVDPLTERQREMIRVGMLAVMEVMVYHNPAAVFVPLDAVDQRGGSYFVRVRTPEGVEEREVVIGITTMREIEIRKGLEAGEPVLSGGS